MKLANERIKEKKVIAKEIISETPVHKEKVEQKIYVGPNLLGLPKYTVVESLEIPHVQSIIKDCPEIGLLFVPINQMAETEARAKQKGTLEHRYYNKVNEFKLGKGDK